MPVAIEDAPVPSRSTATSTSVSLVVRLTDALRMLCSAAQNRVPFIRALLIPPFRSPPAAHRTPCICIEGGQLLNHPKQGLPAHAASPIRRIRPLARHHHS